MHLTALQVLDHLLEGVIVTDTSGNIAYVNDAFCSVTGYAREEAIGQNPRILKSGKQDEKFYKQMWKSIQEAGFWQGEIWNRRKNGEIYLENLAVSGIKDANGRIAHFLGVFSDITDKKMAEEHLSFLAYYDILTGIPNRLLALNRLSQALSHARRYKEIIAVLFLDLDYFKKVNDTMGHSVGDQLIKAVAERLKGCIREEDTVARMGGDEFCVILTEISKKEDASKVAQKILDAVSETVTLSGIKLFTTASIGISFFPSHSNDADTLIKLADQAMYQAKDLGRNTFQIFK